MKTNIKFIKIVLLAVLLVIEVMYAFAQDITASGGTLTVLQENDGGSGSAEGSPMVIDNDIQTKFLSHFPDEQWLQFQLNTPAVVGIYTLTTGNDAPERDPKDWTFEGSHNGTDWTVLDTRSGELLGGRFNTVSYDVDNDEAFEYYRLYITTLNGSGTFQLGEWRLLEANPPEAPSDLSAITTAGDEIILTWNDNSSIEQRFELERSLDNSNFDKIADIDTDQEQYYDKGLNQASTYYYRIRAINSHGSSDYSVVVEKTTMDYSGALWDITDNGGTLTVSDENSNEAENSPKLIDNDDNTKYLVPVPTFWVQYESTSSTDIVTKYSITSANDAPGRDPKNWTFQGSNDGESWTDLDERTDEFFSSRFQERTFSFENTDPYQYYRWEVTANNGDGISQMAEWKILGIPQNAPAVPANLTVSGTTEKSVTLSWDDVATNESGYEIWRSTDGTGFSQVGTTEANANTFTDTNPKVLVTYYYRVRAIGTSGNSIYSSVVNTTIPYDENLPVPATSLTATALSETEVELNWTDDADNEAGYDIERSADGENFEVITSTDADVTSFTDNGLRLATLYYYRVRPFNDYSRNSDQEVPYTDVQQVVTLGTNKAPTMSEIADQTSCNYNDAYIIPVEGLTPGPEVGQNLSLSVVTDNGGLFSDLSVSEVEDGKGSITYKLNEGIIGEANLTITVKDDGGTLNGGTDAFSRTFKITAYELQVEISSDYTSEKVSRGETIELTATGAGDYDFMWQDGPGILSDQHNEFVSIKPNQNHIYVVSASTEEGCIKNAEFVVQMEGSPYLIEPNNILTPNGDLKNDTWVVWNINTYPGNEVKVYDSDGRVVFEKIDYSNDWDGTHHGGMLSSGTYYYIINLGSGIPIIKGTLTILHY